MKKNKPEQRNIHDLLFKQLLETFFIEFIDLFFPEVSKLMDKDHLIFLQQEIITDINEQEQHIVDILVETRLAGEDGLVLLHVENQSPRVSDYNRKMFKYFARLHEKHQRKILPIVIYAHGSKLTEPDNYHVEFSFLKVLEFNYLTLQLKKMSWRKYINSNNPVAAALIHKMNYTEQEKIAVKVEFTRMLVNMQLDMASNTLLTKFMEKYLILTEQEEEIFAKKIKEELTFEEAARMEQITTSYHEKGRIEGKKEGKREGKREGKVEIAQKMLAKGMDIDEIAELTGLAAKKIAKLVK